jgi:uncharacterized protein YjbJ (UPF0337 family)
MANAKSKGSVNETKGKAREMMGKATGNEKQQAKGKAEQAKGKAQKTYGDVKDTAKKGLGRCSAPADHSAVPASPARSGATRRSAATASDRTARRTAGWPRP